MPWYAPYGADKYPPMRSKKTITATIDESKKSWLRFDDLTLTEVDANDAFWEGLCYELQGEYVAAFPGEEPRGGLLTFVRGRATLGLALWKYSAVELGLMRDFLVRVINKEIERSRVRDEFARRAFHEYRDDSHPRLHRGIPEVTYRKVRELADDEGVLDGFEDVAAVGKRQWRPGQGLRGTGSELVERHSSGDESGYDEAESLEPQGVRQAPREPEPPRGVQIPPNLTPAPFATE